MSFTKEDKQQKITDYKLHEKDTGSCEVQVAILTSRIKNLTVHLRTHKKDFASRRGLMMLVGHRNALLKYLKKKNYNRYKVLIGRLEIRKQISAC